MIERTAKQSRVKLPVLETAQRQLDRLTQLDALARKFGLLGDPTRLRILISLASSKELCVFDLADILEMEGSAISHQLRKLLDSGLVVKQRDGTTIYYQLESDILRELFATSRSLLLRSSR